MITRPTAVSCSSAGGAVRTRFFFFCRVVRTAGASRAMVTSQPIADRVKMTTKNVASPLGPTRRFVTGWQPHPGAEGRSAAEQTLIGRAEHAPL